ncbi:receptor-type tyrosine-protein phosphatase mu-like isoform X5 [Pomacea canaliculata]|uniref:receptor-type tyrosine-protein phosphatase mu-like isoform X3 n=1 Tax=Pomacea canaliculata TaxID=400727 RepID=UPI000D72F74A|nr:receptor-type tyrosine-protein phosphatase mu-like isoform X3 [Pomacea canaliculata]XP_025108228.1 receptor-type tyrosine-protein phosphatase mu-like isoform X5 [Pomacea canaliculata]
MRDLGNMADCRCVQVLMFCVFTQMFLLCVAQNTNMKNVAQNKPCVTSSMYRTSNTCSAALNGNTKTIYEYNPPNCIHTTKDDTSPFWWVDLGEKVTITMITIYGRTNYIYRMRCVNVSVDGALVKRFTDVSGWTNNTYTIPVLRGGRVVNITKDCDSDGLWINICEVQVWVCDDGWYDNCSKSCGQCDNNMSCDKVNGNCASCQTGFYPPLCQECADGYYGTDCSQTCGKCGSNSVCDKTSGWCSSCQTRFNPPFCKDCIDGWYGTDCSQTCGNCRSNSVCDKGTGRCTSCKTGFNFPYCKECADGWYGTDCSQTCGNCGSNSVCDKVTGWCTSCKVGFNLPNCKECANDWYGTDCSQTCGNCITSSDCDKTTGRCTSCKAGFNLPYCKECANGWYGTDCSQTCGNCGSNSVCNKTTGRCTSCQTGFTLPLCKECSAGYYGENCNQTCGHCLVNTTCDPNNGTCSTGCSEGYKEGLCNECDVGYYGENCSQLCGHCRQDTTCDPDNGTCLVGCSLGFIPGLCTECDAGYYGKNCDQTCGYCLVNTTCDPVNGTCPSGCSDGYRGSLCTEAMTSSPTESSKVLVGAVVGAVLAVIVAAVVVVIVFMWLRRRQPEGKLSGLLRRKKESPKNEVTLSETTINLSARKGDKPIVPVKPQRYPKPGEIPEVSDSHIYGNLCEDTPTNSQFTSVMTSENTNSTDKNATTRKPVTTKVRTENRQIYENVDLKTSLPTKSNDSQLKKPSTKPDKEDREVMDPTDEEEEMESIYNTEDIYASYRSLGPSSILDDLQKSLLTSLASGKLGMEFADFRKDMHHPHEIGLKSENRNKNRFKALCAYDHSRVVLRRPKGDTNTDYINASYIKGCSREKAYIATQGPRSNTVDDLWWMVWQENATQIVMLTKLIEGGKDKCEEYWPSVGTTKTYGHVTVTALKADTRADFVVRHFVVQSKKGGDQRTVSQYHYLVWPDHGVPSTYSLVSFWRYVKARAQGAIPVVHCSAGVGRTGTYIALDIAADLRSRGRNVNVKEIVSRLREDRTLMVQTEEQYKFLHEVILEEHTSHGTRMTFDQFDIVFPSNIDAHNPRINMEFKLLEELGRFVPKPRHQIAESEENRLKNRNKESLPDDSHLVYLMDRVPGRNQYINAVHMSSFRKVQGLILTQLPLSDTVVDMWRLVDGWDVNTIVSLGHRNQSQSVKNYCHYWPETEKEVLKTGQHTIKLTSTSALGDHLTCYNLSLMTKTSTPREVRVLYYDDWAGVVPGNSSDILHLMDTLESWHIEENTSPVVVQCNDGMTRSGMFCALYEVINGARHDQEIDVYLSVRHVQSVRRKAVTTEAQYRYCYQVAQECKRQESIYQNT